MSVLFMGSGPFGLPTLRRLAEIAPGTVVCTVPDARGKRGKLTPTPIKLAAQELGLPLLEAETLRKEHGGRVLQESRARLVIVADFRLMLTKKFLSAPERACYNLHGSVLPRWRGAAPVQHGVLEGDRTFGVTLYQMVRALDAGPVVDRWEYQPEGFPDSVEIEEHIAAQAADLLEKWLETLLDGDAPLTEQDEDLVTLAPKLEKPMGWIPWHDPAAQIRDRIRALKPWPRTFSEFSRREGADPEVAHAPERWFLDDAAVGAADSAAREPGEIVDVSDDGVVVACGDGRDRIALLRLQRPGKRSLPVADFRRGTALEPGDRFTSSVLPPKEDRP